MIELILGLIVFCLIAGIVLAIIKKTIKFFMYFGIAVVIISVVLGAMLFSDISKLSEKVQTENKLFLFEKNGSIDGGMILSDLSIGEMTYFNEEKIKEMNLLYSTKELDKVLGDNYKLIIIKQSALEKIGNITLNNESKPKEEVLNIINAEKPIEAFIVKMAEQDDRKINALNTEERKIADAELQKQIAKATNDFKAQMNITDDTQFRGMLYAIIASNIINDIPLLLENYKNENIIIYKETMTFELIKLIPSSWYAGYLTQQ